MTKIINEYVQGNVPYRLVKETAIENKINGKKLTLLIQNAKNSLFRKEFKKHYKKKD